MDNPHRGLTLLEAKLLMLISKKCIVVLAASLWSEERFYDVRSIQKSLNDARVMETFWNVCKIPECWKHSRMFVKFRNIGTPERFWNAQKFLEYFEGLQNVCWIIECWKESEIFLKAVECLKHSKSC